ncbi:MAG: hypothetical protein ACTJG1_09210 [Enterococcus gilvus]
MELLKLIKNRISTEWKKTFNDNVDILNGITSDQNKKIDVVDKRIDNLVLHSGGDSPNEVVDARVNNEGKTYETLESRLLAAENKNDQNIEEANRQILENKYQLAQLNGVVRMLYNAAGSNIAIYVSKERGSDVAGDGTQEKPFRTIQTAVNQIPLINRSNTTIFIEDGTYLEDVRISNCSAASIYIRSIQNVDSLDIKTNVMPVKVRSIGFTYCQGYFNLYGLEFVDQANAISVFSTKLSVFCEQGGYLSLSKCGFRENTKALDHNTLYVGGTGQMAVYDCMFVNQKVIAKANLMADLNFASPNGSGNETGVISSTATVRTSSLSSVATTPTKTEGNGLIITKGTVL